MAVSLPFSGKELMEFLQKGDWTTLDPQEIVAAIHEALQLDDPQLARKIASRGLEAYPGHEELNRIADIIAPPTIRVIGKVDSETAIRRKNNYQWLAEHSSDHIGYWVALSNGELLAKAASGIELQHLIKGFPAKQILVTKIG